MNELTVIENTNAIDVFKDAGSIDSLVQQARDFVDGFEHDLSTQAGRKRTASLAAKVASYKVKLDELGKDLVADWKSKSKAVDTGRKQLRDALDELKLEARKPLTEWEAEQAQIEAENQARIKAEELAKEVNVAQELALLMDAEFNRKQAEEKQRIEQQRIKYEENLKHQAAEQERMRVESEARMREESIRQDKQLAEQRELHAKQLAEQAEQRRIVAEKQAALNAELAEKRRLDDIEQTKQQEITRQKQEAERQELERRQREADIENQAKVNNEIASSLLNAGITLDQAKLITKALAKGLVPHVVVNY